ncbi:MAG TPA: helix-turn-helix domain-containing protein [Pseudonocardia sp.]|nr:helix-turn-helix domain-containing protein [Pseudonocardia sp.]
MPGADRVLPAGLTARQLVRDMGPALMRLVIEGPAADDPLSTVTIHAPGEPGELEPGAVVLGVGVTTDRELLDLIAAMGRVGAGVLAVKGPVPAGSVLAGCPVAVIEVNPEASWMHVAATIREYLLDYSRAQIRPDGGTGELFRLANTISASIGGPVTIEDRSSALLAWSAGQDRADSSRIETILGRAVQHRWLTALRERGAFERLHASADPVYVESIAPGQLPRVAIAVRAGSDILGYVWAAVSGPPGEDRLRELRRFAPVVALHLSTIRAETTHARHERREVAAAVLGGSADRAGARRLRLGTGPVCVLAAAARMREEADPDTGADTGADAGTDASEAAELRRFEDAMELYLAAVHPRSVTVAKTGVVYALVGWPAGTAAPLDSSLRLARDFLGRSPRAGDYVVAVGGPAESVEQVARVRPGVDAALRALRHPACPGPAVRTVDDAMLSILLLQLVDAADSLGLPETTGALRRLREHDGADGVLTTTLAAYLDAAGVTEVAADALRIHVNTMRYRLRRIREVAGLDFADADAVLLAQLQLRVDALRTARG